MVNMLASIIIRTYNEERYLNELLQAIANQANRIVKYEVVIVDSGSTDATLEIAKRHKCRITNINKEEFTFGRSLNIGCEFALGDIFVFVSGHCIPSTTNWLDELCKPIIENAIHYSYGKQLGRDTTKYSEDRHFEKWFPSYSKIPQDGFFCNNANAAICRKVWERFKFDEQLTGLEDMFLAKQMVDAGLHIGYVADAPVFHIHDETWRQVKIRYEREAYALKSIMPQVHFSFSDFVRYFVSGVLADSASAIRDKVFLSKIYEICIFRFCHYWGTYRGNHELRKLSVKMKKQYFYPLDINRETRND